MKKDTLIKFIDKYSLNDTIQAVNWKVTAADKTLKSRGELQAKTFIMDVTLTGFEDFTDDVKIPIGVNQTPKIKAMLAPFGDDIKLTLNKSGDRVFGFAVSDKDCESYCTASDPSAIPPVTKDLTDKSTYDVEIALTDDFVSKFLKAKSALDEVNDFTVKMNKDDKVEFLIGFSAANTNRISLIAPTVNGKDKFDGPPIKFLAKNLVEILKANKEIDDGILYLKANGVFKVVYKNDQFQCQYWQFAQIVKK